MENFHLLVISAFLGTAVFFDLHKHRIPNLLVMSALIVAMPLQYLLHGIGGLIQFFSGALVGFFCLLPLYVVGGTSAGDVKLMSAVGALLGPSLALQAAIATTISGGLLALLIVAFSAHSRLFFARYGRMASTLMRTGQFIYVPRTANDPGSRRFAYATAIALGTGVVLFKDAAHMTGITS